MTEQLHWFTGSGANIKVRFVASVVYYHIGGKVEMV